MCQGIGTDTEVHITISESHDMQLWWLYLQNLQIIYHFCCILKINVSQNACCIHSQGVRVSECKLNKDSGRNIYINFWQHWIKRFPGKGIAAYKIAPQSTIYWITKNFKDIITVKDSGCPEKLFAKEDAGTTWEGQQKDTSFQEKASSIDWHYAGNWLDGRGLG